MNALSLSTKTGGLSSLGLSLRGFAKQSRDSCLPAGRATSKDLPAGRQAPRNDGERGQSLAEILIATGILAIFVGGSVGAVAVSIQVLGQNKYLQSASFLAQEILDNTAVLAAADWHKIDRFGSDALSSSPAEYKIITSAPFVISPGSEAVVLDGITYTRLVSFEWVSRDGAKNIEAVYDPSREDPSTIKVTATVLWPNGSGLGIVRYITRGKSRSTVQSDWSGGVGQSGIFSDPGKYDTASVGIDATSQSGSIRLGGIPYP